MGGSGTPPPRTVIGEPSRACGQDRNRQVLVELIVCQCAGRRTTPSGTTPSRTKRHSAIRSRGHSSLLGAAAAVILAPAIEQLQEFVLIGLELLHRLALDTRDDSPN